MIRSFLTVSVVSLALLGCTKTGGSKELKDDKAKISYAIGQQIGKSFKSQNLDVDTDVLRDSINEALAGKESRLKPEEMQAAMERMTKAMMEKESGEGKKNLEAGEKFLAENKTKPGVTTTASGLQYEVITKGKGPSPKATDEVKVHYKGTLLDGSEFDSSYSRNQPAEFPLNGVIRGWTEGLQLMPKGSKYKFYIPAALAYGEHGRPGIPANSTLIFEVELLDIKGKK